MIRLKYFFLLLLVCLYLSTHLLSQDEGRYTLITVEASVINTEFTSETLVTTFIESPLSNSRVPTLYAGTGIGYKFKGGGVQATIGFEYINGSKTISKSSSLTSQGFVSEERKRILRLDQLNINTGVEGLARLMNRLHLKVGLYLPLNVLDNSRLRYEAKTIWSNLGSSGNTQYFLLEEPITYEENYSIRSDFGSRVGLLMGVGLEWNAKEWGRRYALGNTIRTLSLYCQYKAPLSKEMRFVQGAEIIGILSLGSNYRF